MFLTALFFTLIFLHGLVSARMALSMVTAPMVFATAGAMALLVLPGLRDRPGDPGLFLQVAEMGLVLLLFTDASRTDLRLLTSIRNLPARLLSTGMLLTLLLGTVGALLVFPQLTFWEAGILSAILAPTDAGLGQVIVNSPRVPLKIRQGLNVEAGLNDGLSVPFLLFFMAMAGGGEQEQPARLSRFIVEQLGFGVLVGSAIGLVGGWLLGAAYRREWMAHSWQLLGVVVLPLLCLFAADAAGASMFIAAFVAGLAVQVGFRDAARHSLEFTEDWGQLLNLSVFFLFGLLVSREWHLFRPAHLIYAILSLTIVRLLPVAIALTGARLTRATVLFMGWFGPRGLASIVLGLVYLEHHADSSGGSTIRLAVMLTVLLSIFAHGLTAQPGMKLYARQIRLLPPDAAENDGPETAIPGGPSRGT